MKTAHGPWLLIDDVRHYPCDDIARDGRAGLRALREGTYTGLLLDYQLSTSSDEPNGLDVLEHAWHRDWLPDFVKVVSTHQYGAKRIEEFLASNDYMFVDDSLDCEHFILQGYWSKQENTEPAKPQRKRRVTVKL